MDEVAKLLFNNKSPEEIGQVLINLNRYQLDRLSHIKKYKKLRGLHAEILESMKNYIFSGKYDFKKYGDITFPEFIKYSDNFDIEFDIENDDDVSVFFELFLYKNHKKIPSVTEQYIKKNKFRNAEKKKFLECMNNSYVSLFKVVAVDRDNGYVTYQDVYTKKKFKIIDIAMSSSLIISKKREIYTYNRIITYEDISFATGIHCNFSSNSKELMKFIKNPIYNKCSDFIRCLLLYDIYKRDSDIKSTYHHQYGYR